MRFYRLHRNKGREDTLDVPLTGAHLLRHPVYNKGTAFTSRERQLFGLDGLLPHVVAELDDQVARVYETITRSQDPLARYIALAGLQDRNEVLFYRLLVSHLEEFLPIVYTPTVGQACQRFSHIFRRGRGLWITPVHRGKIEDVLACAPFRDVRLIVVTDNERILGLGDQGAGGMGIPIGKLSLYSAGAGIHPCLTLPISLDVGTDNRELLDDPLYVGFRHPRLRGESYREFVDEFVDAVKRVFPHALLQWEDFKKANAFRLLDRHREEILSFNDDIQGTAAVAVAGLMSAARLSGIPLTEQRTLIVGSGAAGIGIARLLTAAMRARGALDQDIAPRIGLTDTQGLLLDKRTSLDDFKRPFAWTPEVAAHYPLPENLNDLTAVIHAFKPTTLIGCSGQGGIFNRDLVTAMHQHVSRPVIFPLSNPTSKAEATPHDLLHWTDGQALVATGSPFDPVTIQGREIYPGQANNVFVFPGVGLGCLVAGATKVTDEMFAVACETLAAMVSQDDLDKGRLYPPISQLREVSRKVAIEVVREACEKGVSAGVPDGEVVSAVDRFMWYPHYPRMVPLEGREED